MGERDRLAKRGNLSRRQFFSMFRSSGLRKRPFEGNSIDFAHWSWNNHLVFGFHKDSSGVVDKNIVFAQAGSPNRKIDTAFKEAQIAARLILNESKRRGEEVFLCVSGGIDSEAMLEAFMAAEEKLSFHAVILRFNDNLNDFDIENVVHFCEKNCISHEIFDLNVLDFFESGKYLEYGKKYQCQSPQLAAHLYLCDHIKGVAVLSWQPPEVSFRQDQQKKLKYYNYGLPGDLQGALLRYFVKRKKFGVPFFFAYTPELLASFFHLPRLQTMIYFSQKEVEVKYSYSIKCLSYRDAGFSVKPRENKRTGFEKVREYYDILDNKKWGVAFNDRYRVPLEKMNPVKTCYQIVPRDTLINSSQAQKLEELHGKQCS